MKKLISILLASALFLTGTGVENVFATSSLGGLSGTALYSDRTLYRFKEMALMNRIISAHKVAPSISPSVLFKVFHKKATSPESLALVSIALLALASFVDFSHAQVGPLVACGNEIIFGLMTLSEIIKLMEPASRILFNRGVLSVGAAFMVKGEGQVPIEKQVPGFEIGETKIRYWYFEVIKDIVLKRDNPVDVIFKPLRKKVLAVEKAAHARGEPIVASAVTLHSRFATTGRRKNNKVQDVVKQAQPGIAPGEWELRWQPESIESRDLSAEYVWVEDQEQFNGDHEGTDQLQLAEKLEKPVDNSELRQRLTRWLGNVPDGDAPLRALLMKMFYVERMWFPAVRYAMFTHVSVPGDKWDREIPFQKMTQWALILNHAFASFKRHYPDLAQIPPPGPASPETAAHMKLQSEKFAEFIKPIIRTAIDDRRERKVFFKEANSNRRTDMEAVTNVMLDQMSEDLSENLDTFLRAASTAFWRNTMDYASVFEVKPRSHGVFGGATTSTLNPPGSRVMQVVICRGQSIVVTFNKEGTLATITSDRGIQKQLSSDPKMRGQLALILNDDNDESLVLGMEENGKVRMTLYSGPDNVVASEEVLRGRIRPLEQLGSPQGFARAKGLDVPDRTMVGLQKSAMGLNSLQLDWKDIRLGAESSNLQPAFEILRLIIQQRIDEAIRKGTGINERSLAPQIQKYLWAEADKLSRSALERSLGEEQILSSVRKLSRVADKAILRGAGLRGKHDVSGLLESIIGRAQTAVGASDRDRLTSLKRIALEALGALDFNPQGGRLESGQYDLVVVGTEKSEMAAEKWAQYQLKPALGLRVRWMSGNDFESLASDYKDDPAGFMREIGINTMRTPVMLLTQSAETSDAGVNSAWVAVTMQEAFGVTGNGDNRLVDRLGKNRVLHSHGNGAVDEDNAADYVQLVQTLNELTIFLLANVTQIFTTGGEQWNERPFFQTQFTAGDVPVLIRSNKHFVTTIAPALLGYDGNGHPLAGPDVERLDKEGLYIAARHLEMVRLWILERGYFAVSGFVGAGVEVLLEHLGAFGLVEGTLLKIGLGLAAFILSAILPVSLLIFMRVVRKAMGFPTPDLLTGFGPPAFVFADAYRYVRGFMELRTRLAFGRAFGINGVTVYSAQMVQLIHWFKAAASRRVVVFIGRPGSFHPALETMDGAAVMNGRQLMSLVNVPIPVKLFRTRGFRWIAERLSLKPVGPEVMMWGHYEEETKDWPVMARNRDVSVATTNRLLVADGESIPNYLAKYWEDNYGGFGRLLAFLRIIATWTKKVASVPPYFEPNRVHANVGVTSTPTPVTGAGILERVATMARTLVDIFSPTNPPQPLLALPFTVDSHPLGPFWGSDVQPRHRIARESLQAVARTATLQHSPLGNTRRKIVSPRTVPAETSTAQRQRRSTHPPLQPQPEPETFPEGTESLAASPAVLEEPVPPTIENPSIQTETVEAVNPPVTEPSLRGMLSELDEILRPVAAEESPKNSALMAPTDRPLNFELNEAGVLSSDGNLTLSENAPSALGPLIETAWKVVGVKEALAQTQDLRPIGIKVAPVTNRAGFYRASAKTTTSLQGGVVLDSQLVQEGLAQRPERAAYRTLQLVVTDELLHIGSDLDETKVQNLVLGFFLTFRKSDQSDVIKYLRNHPHFDPQGLYADLLQTAQDAYYAELGARRAEETRRLARLKAIVIVQEPLKDFLSKIAEEPTGELAPAPAEPIVAETPASPVVESADTWKEVPLPTSLSANSGGTKVTAKTRIFRRIFTLAFSLAMLLGLPLDWKHICSSAPHYAQIAPKAPPTRVSPKTNPTLNRPLEIPNPEKKMKSSVDVSPLLTKKDKGLSASLPKPKIEREAPEIPKKSARRAEVESAIPTRKETASRRLNMDSGSLREKADSVTELLDNIPGHLLALEKENRPGTKTALAHQEQLIKDLRSAKQVLHNVLLARRSQAKIPAALKDQLDQAITRLQREAMDQQLDREATMLTQTFTTTRFVRTRQVREVIDELSSVLEAMAQSPSAALMPTLFTPFKTLGKLTLLLFPLIGSAFTHSRAIGLPSAPDGGTLKLTISPIYNIAPHDTLWGISEKLGVSIANLLKLNPHIHDAHWIYTGQSLKLPENIFAIPTQAAPHAESLMHAVALSSTNVEMLIVIVGGLLLATGLAWLLKRRLTRSRENSGAGSARIKWRLRVGTVIALLISFIPGSGLFGASPVPPGFVPVPLHELVHRADSVKAVTLPNPETVKAPPVKSKRKKRAASPVAVSAVEPIARTSPVERRAAVLTLILEFVRTQSMVTLIEGIRANLPTTPENGSADAGADLDMRLERERLKLAELRSQLSHNGQLDLKEWPDWEKKNLTIDGLNNLLGDIGRQTLSLETLQKVLDRLQGAPSASAADHAQWLASLTPEDRATVGPLATLGRELDVASEAVKIARRRYNDALARASAGTPDNLAAADRAVALAAAETQAENQVLVKQLSLLLKGMPADELYRLQKGQKTLIVKSATPESSETSATLDSLASEPPFVQEAGLDPMEAERNSRSAALGFMESLAQLPSVMPPVAAEIVAAAKANPPTQTLVPAPSGKTANVVATDLSQPVTLTAFANPEAVETALAVSPIPPAPKIIPVHRPLVLRALRRLVGLSNASRNKVIIDSAADLAYRQKVARLNADRSEAARLAVTLEPRIKTYVAATKEIQETASRWNELAEQAAGGFPGVEGKELADILKRQVDALRIAHENLIPIQRDTKKAQVMAEFYGFPLITPVVAGVSARLQDLRQAPITEETRAIYDLGRAIVRGEPDGKTLKQLVVYLETHKTAPRYLAHLPKIASKEVGIYKPKNKTPEELVHVFLANLDLALLYWEKEADLRNLDLTGQLFDTVVTQDFDGDQLEHALQPVRDLAPLGEKWVEAGLISSIDDYNRWAVKQAQNELFPIYVEQIQHFLESPESLALAKSFYARLKPEVSLHQFMTLFMMQQALAAKDRKNLSRHMFEEQTSAHIKIAWALADRAIKGGIVEEEPSYVFVKRVFITACEFPNKLSKPIRKSLTWPAMAERVERAARELRLSTTERGYHPLYDMKQFESQLEKQFQSTIRPIGRRRTSAQPRKGRKLQTAA